MRACEALFGAERGQQIHELVEASIGRSCPCLSGFPCPISPASTEPVLLVLPLMPTLSSEV